jgi:beta-galactosidase
VLADGVKHSDGELPAFAMAPGQTADLDVAGPAALAREVASDGREAHLTFELALREDTPWAPAGHVVASEQIAWPAEKPAVPEPAAGG